MDEDQVAASVYESKLENEEYDVEIACDSRRAFRMLEMEPFDLAILDFSISEMNQVDSLSALCSQSALQGLPVIVLTNAFLPIFSTQTASQAGPTRSVRKSDCTPKKLLAIVREVFAAGSIPAKVSPNVEPALVPAVDLQVGNSGKIRSAELEMKSQARLVANFLAHAPQRLGRLRMGHHVVNKSQEAALALRLVQLLEMHQQARLLAGAAGIAGFRKIAQLASALDALLFQLHGKRAKISASVIHTIGQAVDLLGSLFDRTKDPEGDAPVALAVLVVDDEAISRETICSALEKADLAVMGLEDPMAAEHVLEETHFDLIILDVEMPGQSGIELCARIRKMTMNRTTPVVFVTAHSDFGNHAKSTLSGGNDFIGKPFLPMELTVKALIWLFKENPRPLSIATPSLKGSESQVSCTHC